MVYQRNKTPNYITNFVDVDRRKVVDVVEGKGRGRERDIKTVSMYMPPAFISGIKENFPKAKIIFDKFHVIKILNEKLDAIRIREQKIRAFFLNKQNIYF